MKLKKILTAVVCALMVSACFAGCGDGDSSAAEDKNDTAGSRPEVSLDESKLGDKLKKVAEIYEGGKYTLECVLTGSQIDGAIGIKQVADGDDFYQLQTENLGSHGEVIIDGKGYEFDYVCGMYRENNAAPQLSIISQIAALDISPDSAPWLSDDNYDVEQYTYAGSSYITVTDFYFSKDDGRLVKYVTTYTSEGETQIEETRTIIRLEPEADDKVFNAYFADELVNFDSMSEDQKLGFCQGLCGSWGITVEELYEAGITSDSFKKISYEKLFRLIHNYGKPHDSVPVAVPDVDSSESSEDTSSQDSSAEESSSVAEESSSESLSSVEDTSSENETSSESEASSEEESSSEEQPESADESSDDTSTDSENND